MNLKELREKNKLTQAAFAAPLGVSGKSIYLIESDRMKLRVYFVKEETILTK